MGALTILVADDHPIVRVGVRYFIESATDFTVIAEAGDAAATISAVKLCAPDVVILDLWMGGKGGVELVRQIQALDPRVRILIYSANDERVWGLRMLRAGATGYVMKTSGLEELLIAVRIVADGRRYLSPTLSLELADLAMHSSRRTTRKKPALTLLTNREIQVFRLIGLGQGNAAIALSLRISPRTVGAHRENLKNKLSLSNGVELVQRAASMVRDRII